MKNYTRFAPLAVLAAAFIAPQASAGYINVLGPNSASINFITLTQASAADGGFGESSWSTLAIPAFFGMQVTGHATMGTGSAGDDDDSAQFAYLDWGNAGLGTCKDAIGAPTGAINGNRLNSCQPSSDDNVTENEYLEFTFGQDVVVDNLWFNNNHDGGFHSGDKVTILVGDDTSELYDGTLPFPGFSGTAFDVALGVVDGVNGIGSFFVEKGRKLWVAHNNEEFYVSGMAVSAVPVPASIWLFGTALIGFVGFGRRTSVS